MTPSPSDTGSAAARADPPPAEPAAPSEERPGEIGGPAETGGGVSLDIPRTASGVATILVAVIGPRESGKTLLSATLAPMLAPKERIVCAGPVPTLAEKMGVPWYKVSRLDKRTAETFFGGVERSDAHFFLVVDEADSLLGAASYYCEPLREWIRDNRNFGQGGLMVGHSVGEVHKSFINSCEVIFWSRQSTPGTRDWLRKYASDDMPDIDEVVANLGKYQFLVWAPNHSPNKCLGIAKLDVESASIRIAPLEEVRTRPREAAEAGKSTTTDSKTLPIVGTAAPTSGADAATV